MKLEEMITRLEFHGVRLKADGGRVWVNAPTGAVTEEMRALLRRNRQDIIEYLDRERTDLENLLAWASDLGESGIVLEQPVKFAERPLVQVATREISRYATERLRFISFSRTMQETGGQGRWTATWFRDRQGEAVGALKALRIAIEVMGEGE